MKTKKFLLGTFFFAATMALVLFSCQKDQVEMNDEAAFINLKTGVIPVTMDPWQAGDAAFECEQAGCGSDFHYKVDEWGKDKMKMNGDYFHAGNTITISNDKGTSFSWSSLWKVTCVIVKAGPIANIYYYGDGSYGDVNLVAPTNPKNGKPYGISHVTFCFNQDDNCWDDQTAWAFGPRYVEQGNWATYVPYGGNEITVDIYAGQNIWVGEATFSAPAYGKVTISINLTGAIFYYDLLNALGDDNLKVQDYSNAPSGNPAPGQFAWKKMIAVGETTATIEVPVNNFYGVHLDVAVPCE